jgi:predicted phage baseplate assembly protein
VLLGQAIEIHERDLPSAAEQAAITALEGQDALSFAADDADRSQGVWIRWHAVDDFYSSGPRDRHYVLDQISGELRFGDGRNGLIPPRGRNNIRAARYRSGGGERGNLPAGAINQLKSSVPYLAGVVNLEPATSGAEQETLDELKQRGPRALRHHGRAVTAQDFEDLALLASADVARARAITPDFDPTKLIWLDPAQPIAPSGGSAQHQAVSAGRVEVIIVPRSTAAKPAPDLALVSRVEQALRASCGPTSEVWIAGPDWIEVRVTVQIVPTALQIADALAVAVDTALKRFLHPLTGGLDGNGWAFGRRPYPSDLYAFIEAIDGVDHVQTLTVDVDTPDPARLDRFLVYSGQHRVSLISPDEGD